MVRSFFLSFLFFSSILLPLASTQGQFIACPPCQDDDECNAIKAEGEECGGFCGTKGRCGDGLVCQPVPLSPGDKKSVLAERVHSLMGAPPRRSTCVRESQLPSIDDEGDAKRILVEQSQGNKKKGEACPGCTQQGDPNSSEVISAAVEAVALLVARGDFKTAASPPKLDHVVSVTTQVVSGIRYHMIIKILIEGKPEYYDVDIVSQPWTSPPYHLLGAEKVAAPPSR